MVLEVVKKHTICRREYSHSNCQPNSKYSNSELRKNMKNNKLYIGLAGIAIAMTLPSCESDYLQLTPETSVSSGTMAEETIAAKMGIYGICNAMQTQYYETGYNQYSGEAFINTVFNDAFGPDYICSLWQSSWGASQYNWEAMENERGTINSYPWNYCYNIIGLANGVLDGVDNGNGSQAEKDFIKAQALTFRAHGYEKLLRWYAPRWKDSKNGEAYCVVLRLTSGTNDLPIVTMNQVLDQIYADLDEAIKLYTSSKGKRTYKWEPDIAVAQGVYARTALIKNDWKKAQEMAHAARENYPVADLKTYFAGFVNDTNDNIWSQDTDESHIYYWTWGVNYSCNGNHIFTWGTAAGAISLDLYNALDPNDQRRQLYFTPDKIEQLDPSFNPAGLSASSFWDPALVNSTNLLDCAAAPGKPSQSDPNAKWGLVNIAAGWSAKEAFEINTCETDYGYYPYFQITNEDTGCDLKFYNNGNSIYSQMSTIQLGAQYKFYSNSPYGTSAYPFMRASEMCITEAEAAYMAGDMATAIACLTELNSKRIPGYSCTNTGDALLDEIRLTRRIELWGEGQNWSDFKRWNLPLVRRAWVANDPTSGNYMPGYAVSRDVDYAHGWMFTLPSSESDYNSAIDRNLLYK